jgi:hypothetical protein
MKIRVNREQEYLIGGYTHGSSTFDALIFGYYKGNDPICVARTHNGFTPAVRVQLFRKFRTLVTDACPFVNLPEARSGRWGQGLTKAKMAQCQWLTTVLGQTVRVLGLDGRQPSSTLPICSAATKPRTHDTSCKS